MLKREKFGIETIYVPVKRRGTLDLKRVEIGFRVAARKH
jgi:hypothetical protein